MVGKPLTRNAGRYNDVREAEDAAERRRREELNDIRIVLSKIEGRRFMWRLLAHCSVFGSTFDTHGSKQSYKSGKQDVGHFIMSEVGEADRKLIIKMMQENDNEEKKDE